MLLKSNHMLGAVVSGAAFVCGIGSMPIIIDNTSKHVINFDTR